MEVLKMFDEQNKTNESNYGQSDTGYGQSDTYQPPVQPKAPEAPAPVVQTVEDDGAVIAAITAAISAMLAAENGDSAYQGGFRVVSFKRSNRGTPWNSAR